MSARQKNMAHVRASLLSQCAQTALEVDRILRDKTLFYHSDRILLFLLGLFSVAAPSHTTCVDLEPFFCKL
jgi:hypothetical protein